MKRWRAKSNVVPLRQGKGRRRNWASFDAYAPQGGKDLSASTVGLVLVGAACVGPVVGVLQVPGSDPRSAATAEAVLNSGAPANAEAGVIHSFGFCHTGGGTNCVVDGDTFYMDGDKVRIAGIDAPETHYACASENPALGDAATEELQALLNSGRGDHDQHRPRPRHLRPPAAQRGGGRRGRRRGADQRRRRAGIWERAAGVVPIGARSP